MDLFIEEHGAVMPTEEAKNTFPFSVIWNNDTSTHKDRAIKSFTFIQFMCSPKRSNPFFGYTNPQIRSQKIRENIRKEIPDWEVDELIAQGVEQWMEFYNNASPKLSYYKSALNAASKLEDFFNTFDMEAKNLRTGAPIYKPKEITSALVDSASVMANLAKLESEVNEEVFSSARNKSARTISRYED